MISNWKASPKHLKFAASFRRPHAAAARNAYWEEQLGETVEDAVSRFLTDGALVASDLVQKISKRFTVGELERRLAAQGLRPRRGKSELVRQVIAVGEEAATTSDLRLYQLTVTGEKVINEFAVCKGLALASSQADCFVRLQNGLVREAVSTMAEFRRAYLNPGYPGGSTNVDYLKILFACAPPVLGPLGDADWKQLRVATAMDKLWWNTPMTGRWLPPGFTTSVNDNARAIRLLRQTTLFRTQIMRLHAAGFHQVRLRFDLTAAVCRACNALRGARFDLCAVPDVPALGCTSDSGCVAYADGFDWETNLWGKVNALPYPLPGPTTRKRYPSLRELRRPLDQVVITSGDFDLENGNYYYSRTKSLQP